MEESSKRPAIEHVLIAAQASLNLVPGGGALAVLLDHYIPTTWQRRQEEILAELRDEMERLKGRLNEEKLRSEDFHITMIKVLRDAIVEPSPHKREAFKAIVLNDAMAHSSNTDKDLFIKITEDLTHEHIKALRVLADPQTAFRDNPKVQQAIQDITSPNQFKPIASDIRTCLLQPALPEIFLDHWPVILNDLVRCGLIIEPDPTWGGHPVHTLTDKLKPKTTSLGDRYIKFITLR